MGPCKVRHWQEIVHCVVLRPEQLVRMNQWIQVKKCYDDDDDDDDDSDDDDEYDFYDYSHLV